MASELVTEHTNKHLLIVAKSPYLFSAFVRVRQGIGIDEAGAMPRCIFQAPENAFGYFWVVHVSSESVYSGTDQKPEPCISK